MESETPPEPASAAEPEPGPAPEKKKESWWETARFFLIIFVAAVAIRSLLLAPFSIPSASMLPNVMIGDHLFAAKWSYGYSRFSFPFGIAGFDGRVLGGLPERGDIVVFRYPGPRNEDYIKRVIALPGDTVALEDGRVVLNGAPLPRRRVADYLMPVSPNSLCETGDDRDGRGDAVREVVGPDGEIWCAFPRFVETLPGGRSYHVLDRRTGAPGDGMDPVTVPEGMLFVMGDNRDDSLDSRFGVERGGVGLLPVDHLLGRATIAFWSTDGSAEWLKPWTWFTAARWRRIGETW